MDTVEGGANGKIRYETEDGKRWSVEMRPDGTGGYRYGTPEEAK